MNHTPSPWIIHNTRSGVKILDTSDTRPEFTRHICEMYEDDREDSPADVLAANAALIAAAPELLAVLRKAVSLRQMPDGMADLVIEEIHAAINKATGQA